MAYNEDLAERVLGALGGNPGLESKKMFGGLAYMLRGNLACGVLGNDLMVRVPKDEYEAALAIPHVREMDFTGRPMRGWVVVGPAATNDDASLQDWVAAAVAYALTLPPK